MQEKIKIENGIKYQSSSGQHEHLVMPQTPPNKKALLNEQGFGFDSAAASYFSLSSLSRATSTTCVLSFIAGAWSLTYLSIALSNRSGNRIDIGMRMSLDIVDLINHVDKFSASPVNVLPSRFVGANKPITSREIKRLQVNIDHNRLGIGGNFTGLFFCGFLRFEKQCFVAFYKFTSSASGIHGDFYHCSISLLFDCVDHRIQSKGANKGLRSNFLSNDGLVCCINISCKTVLFVDDDNLIAARNFDCHSVFACYRSKSSYVILVCESGIFLDRRLCHFKSP
jgi:hypothetical protein